MSFTTLRWGGLKAYADIDDEAALSLAAVKTHSFIDDV